MRKINLGKLLALCLALLLCLSACTTQTPPGDSGDSSQESEAPSQEAAQSSDSVDDAGDISFIPGTYEGSAQGYGGTVTLAVTVSDSRIESVDILEESETEALGGAALPRLAESLVDSQSLAIDAVSGCTVSSNAFLEAAAAALSQSGVDMDRLQSQSGSGAAQPQDAVEATTDVLIAGAGGAGLSAAVTAAQGGASVTVIEKMAFAGGATAMAGGGTNATGSQAQQNAGVEDSPEWLFMDIMYNGHFKADPQTTWLYATTVGRAFDWLSSPEGADVPYGLDAVPGPSAEHRAGRTFSGTGGGSGVVTALLEKAESLGVEIVYETPGTQLLAEGGKITGMAAQGANGTPYVFNAGAVILATGGYGANDAYLTPEILALPYAGAVSSTGDGLEMAMAVGAEAFKLDLVNIQPHSIRLPDGRGQHTYQGCLAMYNGTGSILVSNEGRRFVNEQASANDIIAGMNQHTNSYLVMDAQSFETYTTTCINSRNYTQEQLDTWLEANGTMNPVFATADTLEELAAIVSMPGDALAETVAGYNASVAAGEDEEFGRRVAGPMSSEGPYHLVEMNLRYYATLGGLHINDDMQVLSEEGDAIEGLYAAGEVVGGVLGDIYIPGGLFGWAMTSGHNAGLAVTEYLG